MPPSLPGPERDSCCKTPSLALALEHPGEAAGAPGNLLLRGSRPLTRGCYYFIVFYFYFSYGACCKCPIALRKRFIYPWTTGILLPSAAKGAGGGRGCSGRLRHSARWAAGATAAANLQLPRARARGIFIIFSGRNFQRKDLIDVVLPLSNNQRESELHLRNFKSVVCFCFSFLSFSLKLKVS